MEKEKRSFNLCTTYILPLIGLNKFSFGNNNDSYINSYLSEDDSHVIVELQGYVSNLIANHANYRFAYPKEGHNFVVFELPSSFKKDVQRFREGKYSEFSEDAKKLIRKKSGLKYKVPVVGGKVETDIALLALDKDQELREYLEKKLGVKLAESAELASIPGEENFLELGLTVTH